MNRWRAASLALATTSLALLVAFAPATVTGVELEWLGTVLGCYGLLVATSGYVVDGTLRLAGAEVSRGEADTGRAVGKVENVLILTLTLLSAYTALGLVFTAKSIVRWQDITSGNTTYYLTGSVANVTYSLVYGVTMAALIPGLPVSL